MSAPTYSDDAVRGRPGREHMSWDDVVRDIRPWWAWLNPWRYAHRMERSYASAMGALESHARWAESRDIPLLRTPTRGQDMTRVLFPEAKP